MTDRLFDAAGGRSDDDTPGGDGEAVRDRDMTPGGGDQADAPASADDQRMQVQILPDTQMSGEDRGFDHDSGVDRDDTTASSSDDFTGVQASAAGGAPRPFLAGDHLVAAAATTTGPHPIRRWDLQASANVDDGTRRPDRLGDRHEVEVTHEEQQRRRTPWWEFPAMIMLALVLAFLLRTFVVQVFWIPSGSMIDTLEVNDRIAVEKLSYRVGDIERGDVVVFADPEPRQLPDDAGARIVTRLGQFVGVVPVDAQDFVKRVIGMPGDTVRISNGVVSVNGVELDEPYALLDSSNGEWEVPPDRLFVMGDNRGGSNDSRGSLGFIDVDDVVGRAVAKIWPPARMGGVETADAWEPIPDPN